MKTLGFMIAATSLLTAAATSYAGPHGGGGGGMRVMSAPMIMRPSGISGTGSVKPKPDGISGTG